MFSNISFPSVSQCGKDICRWAERLLRGCRPADCRTGPASHPPWSVSPWRWWACPGCARTRRSTRGRQPGWRWYSAASFVLQLAGRDSREPGRVSAWQWDQTRLFQPMSKKISIIGFLLSRTCILLGCCVLSITLFIRQSFFYINILHLTVLCVKVGYVMYRSTIYNVPCRTILQHIRSSQLHWTKSGGEANIHT